MTETDGETIEQPDFERMSVRDWRDYLRQNPDWCLVINAQDGVHSIQYEPIDDEVTFFAHGSMGYDQDGTQAVLQSVAGCSDGLQVQTKDETYGDPT